MLELLGTIFGSIFSGGATGLIGVVLQRWADYKNKQLDMQLESQRFTNTVALRKVDAEIMAQEWASKTEMAKVEATGRENVEDAKAFAASFKLEPERYSDGVKPTGWMAGLLVLVDVCRGLVRPILTVYLCGLTTYVWYQVRSVLAVEDLAAADVLDIWKMVVGTILYLTTTCVLWWFGTRNKQTVPTLGKTG